MLTVQLLPSISHACYIQLDCSSCRRTRKKYSRKNRKGYYDESETTYEKVSTRRIQICRVHTFICDNFPPFFQNNFPNNVWTKSYPEESDLPRQTLLCRGLRSLLLRCLDSFFYIQFFKEVKLVCVRSIIKCSCVRTRYSQYKTSISREIIKNLYVDTNQIYARNARTIVHSSDSVKKRF